MACRRPSRTFLAAGLLGTVAYMLLPRSIQTFGYAAFGLACVAAITVGVARHRPERPTMWWLFAAGMMLFVAGDGVQAAYEATERGIPQVSAADALYLGGYALLAGGLAALVRGRRAPADRSTMIDALIVGVGVATLVWCFWMAPQAGDASLPLPAKVIALAYPVMDLVLLAGVLRLALGPNDRSPAFLLLGFSVVVLLASDVAYGLAALDDAYHPGSPIDAGFALSYVLWGAAALDPAMATLAVPSQRPAAALTTRRLALLAAAALAGPIAMGVRSMAGGSVDVPATIAGSAIVFGLVIARMALLMRRLDDTAARHARATQRERTLRRAAGWLVAESDRDGIFSAACSAAAAVAGGSGCHRVTVWTGSPGDDSRALVLPLRTSGGPRTGLRVESAAPLAPEAIESLETIADLVATALDANRLADELRRRDGDRRFAALVEQASDVITLLDTRGEIAFQTASAQRILGHRPEDVAGSRFIDLVHPEDRLRALGYLTAAQAHPGASPPAEWRVRHAEDGEWRRTENVANNLLHDRAVRALVLSTRDVTARRRLEEELEHQALHDGLTGLANRTLFRDRVRHALSRPTAPLEQQAVICLDIDRFNRVNEGYGATAGDDLLVEVAERLRQCCRRGDTPARLGGDEFAVLLEDVGHPEVGIVTAERIAAALAEPFRIRGHAVHVTASIGVALHEGPGVDADDLLRNADVAMYVAKDRGQGHCEVYDGTLEASALERLELELELRDGPVEPHGGRW